MQSTITPLRKEVVSKMNGLILDVGVGDDAYFSYLKGKVIAADIDQQVIRNSSGIRVVGDIACLPFKDESFDSVWACAIIEHTKDDTIPELVRVAKKGGQIAILTPNRYSPMHLLMNLWGHPCWWREPHVRLYDYSQLSKYGKVLGEIWRFPVLDKIVRKLPMLGHTLMLYFRK